MNSPKEEEELLPLYSLYQEDEIISGILGVFVRNIPNYLEELKSAIADGQWEVAAGVCHKLKGTASGYGYPEVAMVSSQLEDSLLNSEERDLYNIDELVAALTLLSNRAHLPFD